MEAQRFEELEKEEARDRQEQLERARLRGDHALRKEKSMQVSKMVYPYLDIQIISNLQFVSDIDGGIWNVCVGKNNARLLCQLERLHQAELQRRRNVVNSMPAQIFQPFYRHDDLRAEQQRELEIAFQDLCTEDKGCPEISVSCWT